MTIKEQSRIQVLNGVIEREVTVPEAAGADGSERAPSVATAGSVQRGGSCCYGSREQGQEAVYDHVPRDTTEGEGAPYAGFNHTHLTEMLAEREDIHLSRSTVRRILLAEGVRSPRRRKASRRYSRRERYPQEGMLLQIDGSQHDWLQGRGPRLTLIGTVDDATGTVPFALFRHQEDAHGYMLMLREIIDRHGVPWLCTVTGMASSSAPQRSPRALPSSFEAGVTPHNSAGLYRSWTFASSWPTHHRRRAA